MIVPAYDVGEYLPACLDSILASTLRDLEIIVVDDGSPDESGEIAESYAEVDARVKVLHTRNQGLGPARNTGVAAASGEYLAFVDSDDLVPPRAYQLLVETLERSGSDFAAGNAWRYIEGEGNIPSWTHEEAFATDRIGTHVREFPALVRDRMAWNKVYRRSFWDAGGYEFPAIRYEDYPVTLRAHLEARRVDVLSDKVYLWRQRSSEGSITQRSLQYDNVADRVVSARMVLDLVEDEDAELRRRVHEYLIDVDLVTLATAVAMSTDERRALAGLATEFARSLDPDAVGSTRLADAVFRLLRRGDAATAAAVAGWRVHRDRRALLRGLARPTALRSAPTVLRSLARNGRTSRGLDVRVLEVVRTGGAARMMVHIDSTLAGRLDLSAALRGQDVETGLDIRRVSRSTAEISFDEAVVRRLPEGVRTEVVVTGHLGPLRRRGTVHAPGMEPHLVEGDEGSWMVLGRNDVDDLLVERAPGRTIADFSVRDDRLEVAVRNADEVAVLRPEPSAPLTASVVDGVASFHLADVVDDPVDDPVTGTAVREVVAMDPDGAPRRLVLRQHPAQPTTQAGHVVTIHRLPDGTAALTHQLRDHAT